MEEGKGLARYPDVFVSYAETLTVADRELLEIAFRCNVVNHYGSLEIPFIAQTCPDNPDLFHVNNQRAIVRVVGEDGKSAAPGELGRVVITDLFNYVMPFINYDIGDFAVTGKACSCGRGLPTLERIEGRVSEVIRKPGGGVVSPSTLESFLLDVCFAAPYVWEYQAIQDGPDSICLKLVPTSIYSEEFATKLKEDLAEFLGPGMNVSIETHDRIDLQSSGKRLIIKSEIA
jgi:phenylacetate-CoA ligase